MRRIYTSDDLDDYLEHHGILGQKWGKLNGPPYPLGIEDHSSAQKEAAAKAGVTVGKSSGKGSVENIKNLKIASDNINKAATNIRDINSKVPHKQRDLSKVSDDELRRTVNRVQLEQQYNLLMDNQEYYKSGRAKIADTMNKIGSVAMISSSVLGSAVAIKTLMNKK